MLVRISLSMLHPRDEKSAESIEGEIGIANLKNPHEKAFSVGIIWKKSPTEFYSVRNVVKVNREFNL